MRRAPAAAFLLVVATAPGAWAAEWSAGYSGLRENGDLVHGAALGARWHTGSALRLAVEATAHSGTSGGETMREIALLGGPQWELGRDARLSPFLSLKGGVAGRSSHVEVFGVSISPTGVCSGSCGYDIGPAGEAGGGFDLRLAGRLGIRPEAEYRVRRLAGVTERGWRFGALLVWR